MEYDDLYYYQAAHFQGTNRVVVGVENYRIEGDSVMMELVFRNNYAVPFDFCHAEMPVTVFAAYLQGDQYHLEKCNDIDIQIVPAKNSVKTQVKAKYFPHQPCVICLANSMNVSVNSGVVNF